MKVEFEWRVVPHGLPGPFGQAVWVVERLVGHEAVNQFGPMPEKVARSFVTARRQFINRNIKRRYQAIQLFTTITPQGVKKP
jgi:hypothetical protein